MKTLLTILGCCFLAMSVQAQNPWKSIGREAEVLTLSNGQYQEFIPNDTVVVIGSVLFNTITEEIVGFVEEDSTSNKPGFEPEVTSRWLSVDPLAREFPSLSPYNYVENNPIKLTDPTGMYPVCGNACDETYKKGNIVENKHGSWEYQGDNQWVDLNTGETHSGVDLLGQFESQFAPASMASLGVSATLALAEPTPLGEVVLGLAATGFVGYNLWESLNTPSGTISIGNPTLSLANHEQDKKLTPGEIKRLEDAGIDVHKEKGGKRTGKTDLYKKPNGDIVIKPKGGKGPGEPTGLNINNF